MRRVWLMAAALVVATAAFAGLTACTRTDAARCQAQQAVTLLHPQKGEPISSVRARLWEIGKARSWWEITSPEQPEVTDEARFTYGFEDGSTLTLVAIDSDGELIYLGSEITEDD